MTTYYAVIARDKDNDVTKDFLLSIFNFSSHAESAKAAEDKREIWDKKKMKIIIRIIKEPILIDADDCDKPETDCAEAHGIFN
jgi:hypothetical protein